jgi:hypothetical protein
MLQMEWTQGAHRQEQGSLRLCRPGQRGRGRPHSRAAPPGAAGVAGPTADPVQAECAHARSLPARLYALPVSAQQRRRYMYTSQILGEHLCIADTARSAGTSTKACHRWQAHMSYEEVCNVSMPSLDRQVQRCVAAVVCCSVEQRPPAVLDR